MKANVHGLAVAVVAVGLVVAFPSEARADVVNDPGTFDFDITHGNDSLFRFTSGKVWEIDDGGAGFIETDIDSTGAMSDFGTADFGTGSFTVLGVPVSAQLLVQGTSSGLIDPASTDTLEFDMVFKVRFTWNGTSSCTTSAFSATLDVSTWLADTGGGNCGGNGYDESTGVYCVAADGFTVPQLAATACGSHGNDINSAFSLGLSTDTYMQIQEGVVDPIVD